jgi:hypothetical protein
MRRLTKNNSARRFIILLIQPVIDAYRLEKKYFWYPDGKRWSVLLGVGERWNS